MATAPLLLEGNIGLEVRSGANLSERLAVLDAVLALLPYGLRAGMFVSTTVDNPNRHVIDLAFTEYRAPRCLVRLGDSVPIPRPDTELGRAYLSTLHETVRLHGLWAVVEHLWRAEQPLFEDRPSDALGILSRLGPTPAMRTAMRADDALAARIDAEADAREGVHFTVSYPGVLTPSVRQPLHVLIHRDSLRSQLDARLAELEGRLSPYPYRASSPANSRIDEGARLEIQPLITNVNCYPPRRTITWRNELAEAAFKIEYTSPFTTESKCTGSVLVSAGGLLIADISVSLTISEGPAVRAPQHKRAAAQMVRHVFGSYAREDAALVSRFREAYRALGIHLFIDTLDIPGGATWRSKSSKVTSFSSSGRAHRPCPQKSKVNGGTH
jgi:hypothetical protein